MAGSCQPDLQFNCSDVKEDDNGDGWHSIQCQNMDTRAAVDTSQCARCKLISNAAERIVVPLEQFVGSGCRRQCTTKRAVDDVLTQLS